MVNKEFQTTFDWSRDHFSLDHERHSYGSTALVQRDFGLRQPDGSVEPLVGVASPSGVEIQTTLRDFSRR